MNSKPFFRLLRTGWYSFCTSLFVCIVCMWHLSVSVWVCFSSVCPEWCCGITLVVGGDSHVILRGIVLSLCKPLPGATDRIRSGHRQVQFVYLPKHVNVSVCVCLWYLVHRIKCVCGAVILILRTQAGSLDRLLISERQAHVQPLLSVSYLKFTCSRHTDTQRCTRTHSGSVTIDDVVQVCVGGPLYVLL